MSDYWINIRFGVRHLKIGPRFPFVFIEINHYHVENKPEKYFQIYD